MPEMSRRVRSALVKAAPEPLLRFGRRVRWEARKAAAAQAEPVQHSFPDVPGTPIRLLVGPANFAGQGWAWGRAAERIDGVGSRVLTVDGGGYSYGTDYGVSQELFRDPAWQVQHERYVLDGFSHVLLEAVRPVLGLRSTYVADCRHDVEHLHAAGLATALVAHGSDVRLPSRHAARERWSPFRDGDELNERLEKYAKRSGDYAASFDGPVFVSTPDLLVDLPRAHWLPVVVDTARWLPGEAPMQRRRPVVMHAPSNPRLKGTATIEEALTRLEASGVVEYRRIEGVPNAQMPAVLAEADIVVDQLAMGLYGVAAAEAMAAGRVVVSYVGEVIRGTVRAELGREVPIAEADPETLADVVAGLAADRDRARDLAAEGIAYARDVHDGGRSAEVLRPWLSEETSRPISQSPGGVSG